MTPFFRTYIQNNLIWSEGRSILLITAIMFCIGLYASTLLAIASLMFALLTFLFFRNPDRTCPLAALHDPKALLSPADGRIVAIDEIHDAHVGDALRVSIFLSPLDVHVNWIPVSGTIQKIEYHPGKFIVAFAPKSSEINEHNDIVITTNQGATVVVRQIAGFIARRICCWVTQGQHVARSHKYGMIRFGSRVEIIMPNTTKIFVTQGQYVYGATTIIGKLP